MRILGTFAFDPAVHYIDLLPEMINLGVYRREAFYRLQVEQK